MNILKSFENFIFEVVGWLYFYPRTMFLSLFRPGEMMAYADDELDDLPADQYESTISPPLFLLITIVLATWASDSISGPDDPATTPALLLDWKNSLLLTASIYSVYPLVMAIALLRQRHRQIDRRALRPPFYSQCFVAAPFALANALAISLFALENDNAMIGGGAIFVATLIWYFILQARWFAHQLGVSTLRACWIAGNAIGAGFAITGGIIVSVFG
ncbi:hypothetical protein [Blastomonas sp.]|uniref:hypothetical protein n=1 Tax=Blastomonas sp. TaxID=1909299 RepID=UPI00391B0D58